MKYHSAISQVWIDLVAHEKLWAWTRMAKGEVSMLGLVEDAADGPAITDLFLIRQTCTSSSTDMDQGDVARLLTELAAEGIEGQLRAWVHSHAEMEVFWSNTDDRCIEGLQGNPYTVSVVVNRKGDVRARIDVFHPIRVVIDDVPVNLRVPNMGLDAYCASEFQAKVVEVPQMPPMRSFNGMSPLFPCDRQMEMFTGSTRGRSFVGMDIDDLEAAVYRGDLTVDEYIELTEGRGFIDPFPDPQEVLHDRRA